MAVTRDQAIAEAAEAVCEDVICGDLDYGCHDIELYEAPEWCERWGCQEHDHCEWAHWLVGWGKRSTVTIEVTPHGESESPDADWVVCDD